MQIERIVAFAGIEALDANQAEADMSDRLTVMSRPCASHRAEVAGLGGDAMSAESDGSCVVVLVHGLGAHRLLMTPLERRLIRAGFRTINWGYNSLIRGVEFHGEVLLSDLTKIAARSDVTQVHIVGHSMGSIVVRLALAERIKKLGRVIMLCPPNQGSYVATWFTSTLGRLWRPVAELADRPESLVNRLPPLADVEVGVVAAANDILIRRESTHLTGETDHIVLPGPHGLLPFRRDAARQVAAFLKEGCFLR